MRNLLCAGFTRLWKNKTLWIACAIVAVVTVIAILYRYSYGIKLEKHYTIDSVFGYFVLCIAILIPVICTLFLGPEYADGTIRNKVICGHKKSVVYLSNLILCSVASLIMCSVAVASGLCLGLPLLGKFAMGSKNATIFFLGVYTLSLSWSAIVTLLAMLVSNRAISAVVAIVIALLLLVLGFVLFEILSAGPTISGYFLADNGVDLVYEEQPNPNYIPEGAGRQFLQFFCDFFPGGQTIQYIYGELERPIMAIVWNGVLFTLATGVGLVLFYRKDIK